MEHSAKSDDSNNEPSNGLQMTELCSSELLAINLK